MTPWAFRTHKIRWRGRWTLTTANPCSTSSRTGDFPPHDFARWVYIMYSDSVSLSCLSSGGDGGERWLRQAQRLFRNKRIFVLMISYAESICIWWVSEPFASTTLDGVGELRKVPAPLPQEHDFFPPHDFVRWVYWCIVSRWVFRA